MTPPTDRPDKGHPPDESAGAETRPERDADRSTDDDRTVSLPQAGSGSTDDGLAPEGESRFVAGQILAGRYRIVHALGRGGMGEVHRADDLTLRQPVALKFLPPGLEKDPGRLELLFNEVKTARRITHPNVCRVYDLGQFEDQYFVSMEYIDGEDLRSLLRRIGRLPRAKALEIGRQIAVGLAAAHDADILHRDLKPANLMIDGEGRARITDFGLAAVADSIRGAAVASGTPAYMAPEQLSGREVSERSDLYALGLVLYELFTGHRPFTADSVASALEAQQTPPTTLPGDVDPAVEGVILRCLEPDPSRRPATAHEIVAAFDIGSVLEEEGTQVRTLVMSRLLDREGLIERLGEATGAEIFAQRDRLARKLGQRYGGREIEVLDGTLLLFQRPWEAVQWALAFQAGMVEISEQTIAGDRRLETRIGIHLGEVTLRRNPPAEVARGSRPLEIEGSAAPTTNRLTGLAGGGQILLTRAAFDLARRSAVGERDPEEKLRWLAHGSYLFQGSEEPEEVFEVGLEGLSPLEAPAGSDKAARAVAQETIPGWRPAPGLAIPSRKNWIVERKVGEGGFGEVWLVSHEKTREHRVFKFCYEAEKLRSLHREITVFRLLKEELGDRQDIARLLDWNLDQEPYFIEFAYTEAGSLAEWWQSGGGGDQVPLAERLELAAQVATALDAAHSVGVLHKDVKPSNVLINERPDGRPQATLTDFGIGLITDRDRLAARGITAAGVTEMDSELEGRTSAGTQLYMAPELLAGKAPSIHSDIYALGVMLYQMVAGDLERPLAAGWERHVEDDLLRQDIARMIDGSPGRRPRSAAEVAESLRSLEERRAEIEAGRQAEIDAARSQRRRRLLGITAAVSTAFLIVVSFLAIQAVRARSEAESARQDAERRRTQAEGLIGFMLTDLHDGLEKIGRLDLLAEVARGSRQYFDSLTERDRTAAAAYQRGLALLNVGDVLLDQGDAEGALTSHREAQEIFERGAEDEPEGQRWRLGLALAHLRRGEVLSQQADTATALIAFEEALAAIGDADRGGPTDLHSRFLRAQARFEIADLTAQSGAFQQAAEQAAEVVTLADGLIADDAPEPDWRHRLLLLDAHALIGEALRLADDEEGALAALRRARALAGERAEKDPANAIWERRLAGVDFQLGFVHYLRRDWDAALRAFDLARAAYERFNRLDPERVEWRFSLAESLRMQGNVLIERDRPEESAPYFERALPIMEELAADDPTRLRWREWLAKLHQTIASSLEFQGDYRAALAAYQKAHLLREEIAAAAGDDLGPRNEVAFSHVAIGEMYLRLGDERGARHEFERALEDIEPVTARSNELFYVDTHAQALMRLGRFEEARPLVEDLRARGWDDLYFTRALDESGMAEWLRR